MLHLKKSRLFHNQKFTQKSESFQNLIFRVGFVFSLIFADLMNISSKIFCVFGVTVFGVCSLNDVDAGKLNIFRTAKNALAFVLTLIDSF